MFQEWTSWTSRLKIGKVKWIDLIYHNFHLHHGVFRGFLCLFRLASSSSSVCQWGNCRKTLSIAPKVPHQNFLSMVMIRIPCGEYLGHGQATCWRHQNLQHQQTLFWPPGQNSVVQLKQLSAWLPPDQEWHMTEMPIWSKCPATILTALSRNFTPSSGCAAQSLRVSKISCPSKLNPFLSPDIWQYQTTRASGIEKPPILKMERMLKCVISTLHVHISIRHSQLKTALPSSTRQLTTQSGKGILVLSEVG